MAMMSFGAWWRNAPESWRRGFKSVAAAIVISLGATSIGYIVAFFAFNAHPFPVTADRFPLFLDAVLAGIVAFALLGAFTFIDSIRNPADEKIDNRIAYLFSADLDHLTAKSKAYLKKELLVLGAVVKESRQVSTFFERSPNRMYVRSSTHVLMKLCNLMKLDTYEQVLPLTIEPESMPGLHCRPGIMQFVRTTALDAEGRVKEVTDVVKWPEPFDSFDKGIHLKIPPSGQLIYEYMFETWGPLEEPNAYGANRFAEKSDVGFVNRTGGPMEIHPMPQNDVATIDRVVLLNDGQEAIFPFLDRPAGSFAGAISKVC